ncbi:hypothetical protein GCM10009718_28230 [Isoptericola halotolerans]
MVLVDCTVVSFRRPDASAAGLDVRTMRHGSGVLDDPTMGVSARLIVYNLRAPRVGAARDGRIHLATHAGNIAAPVIVVMS